MWEKVEQSGKRGWWGGTKRLKRRAGGKSTQKFDEHPEPSDFDPFLRGFRLLRGESIGS
jgi:hypothetical protein